MTYRFAWFPHCTNLNVFCTNAHTFLKSVVFQYYKKRQGHKVIIQKLTYFAPNHYYISYPWDLSKSYLYSPVFSWFSFRSRSSLSSCGSAITPVKSRSLAQPKCFKRPHIDAFGENQWGCKLHAIESIFTAVKQLFVCIMSLSSVFCNFVYVYSQLGSGSYWNAKYNTGLISKVCCKLIKLMIAQKT